VQGLLKDLPIHGLAHITGGGIVDNIVRIIPQGLRLLIRRGSWEVPPVFAFLQQAGNVPEAEMLRTFNNGIGMVAVVPEASATEVLERLAALKEKAFLIGEVLDSGEAGARILWA
jgi:phosphoribosylformylglycinamidine cyclo-ligase